MILDNKMFYDSKRKWNFVVFSKKLSLVVFIEMCYNVR